MPYYAYILQSEKDGRFYFGQTENLVKRIAAHNSGRTNYTSRSLPWRLIWYQAFNTRNEAYKIEQKLKRFKSRARVIKYMEENPFGPGSENLQIEDLLDFREST